jgi:hypothetical protein
MCKEIEDELKPLGNHICAFHICAFAIRPKLARMLQPPPPAYARPSARP